MQHIKKAAIFILIAALLSPAAAFASPVSVDRLNGDHIEPLIKTDFIKALYYKATSTTATSTLNVASTTKLCIANECKTAWDSFFAYLFPNNATTTGLGIYASTTIGAGAQTTGLTISGGATTSAGHVFQSTISLGGVSGNTWDDFCTTITGSSELCDGDDEAGAGGSAFEVATTTDIAVSQLAYINKASGRTTLASVATGTVSGTNGITVTAGRSAVGGALAIDCTVASGSAAGCLSTTDWTTFNNSADFGWPWTTATNFGQTSFGTTTAGWFRASGVSLAASSTAWFDQINVGSTTSGLMATSTFYGNVEIKGNLRDDSITSAILFGDGIGEVIEYAGTSCAAGTGLTALDAAGSGTCGTFATFAWPFTVSNPNGQAGVSTSTLMRFLAGASTTAFSANTLAVGQTGTTTISSTGALTVSGDLTVNGGTWNSGGVDLASGDAYEINGTSVLNATTLGTAVVTSSLTSVGTLTSLSIDANGVVLDTDGDGRFSILGAGTGADEEWGINLDDTTDEAVVTSSSGVATTTFSSMGIAATRINTTTASSTMAGLRIESGGLRIASLASCDTLDTDGSGNVICGADAEGAGGGGSDFSFQTHFGAITAATSSPVLFTGNFFASSTARFSGEVGVGTSTPWGIFSIASSTFNYTKPLFVIATSGSPVLVITATTSPDQRTGARFSFGTTTPLNGSQYAYFFDGDIRSTRRTFDCPAVGRLGLGGQTADITIDGCNEWRFDVDNTAVLFAETDETIAGDGTEYTELVCAPDAVTTANCPVGDGGALYSGGAGSTTYFTGTASSSMTMEAIVAVQPENTSATSSRFFVGFRNRVEDGNLADTDAQLAADGHFAFIASSTGTWVMSAFDTGGTYQWANTGIAATSTTESATNSFAWQKLRVSIYPISATQKQASFYIDDILKGRLTVTTVGASAPLNGEVSLARIVGGERLRMRIANVFLTQDIRPPMRPF